MQSPIQPPWRVLLLGDNAGVGKTRVSRALAHRWGVSVLLADDIRMALQVTTSAQQLDLYFFMTDPAIWQRTPEELCGGGIGVAKVVSSALKIVIAHHAILEDVGPLIIEGDAILPELSAQKYADVPFFTGLEVGSKVRTVFLVEENEQALLETLHRRGRGFEVLPEEEQETFAKASHLYGQWLQREAQAHNVPVLPAHPWETLHQRIIETINPH